MNLAQFNSVVDNQLNRCRSVLDQKGHEYVFGEDRLEHFKSAGAEQDESPAQALWGMASKHITSLGKMCKSNQTMMMALWDEKITDSINYLLLLRALVEEEA
jgi:hypothetical protein